MTNRPYNPTDQISHPQYENGEQISASDIRNAITAVLNDEGDLVSAAETLRAVAENQNWVVYVP
jgi:hypothetical protein